MSRFVDLRPGEGNAVAAAFCTLFGVTAGHTLLETARDALFLAKLEPSRLPWVSLAIAVLGIGISRLRRPGAPPRGGALAGALLAAAVVTVGFWVAAGWRGAAFLYALYVWTGMFASWAVLRFWMSLGERFTIAEARRLYGVIGSGSVVGAVAGAFAARLLAGALPARALLLAAASVFAVTALVATRGLGSTARPAEDRRPEPVAGTTPPARGSDLAFLARHPYLRRLGLVALLATLTVTVVDYVFKAALASRVPRDELGAAFANVYLGLNLLALAVQVFLVGPFLQRLGVQRSIWVTPILIAVAASGLLGGGGLVAALALRGVDGALRHSLHRTSVELLWVPVPDRERTRAKPVVDLAAQRGGQAAASLGILGLVALGAREPQLAIVIIVLAAGWALALVGLKGHYLEIFRQNLKKGRIEVSAELPPLDLEALEALFSALNSRKDAEVLAALELLSAQSRQRLIPALILYHPSRRVVLRALELLAAQRRTDFVPVAERLLDHQDPEVRAAAVRAIDAVDPRQPFLRARLDDPHLEVRATAMVALLSHGWITGPEADEALRELVSSEAIAVRVALARAIAQDPSPRFDDVLETLAQSREPEVQMEAAAAMGRRGAERFVPILMELLTHSVPASTASDALARIGPRALAALDRALGDPATPAERRWALPRGIGAFPIADAVPILLSHLERTTDAVIRSRILKTLVRLRALQPDLVLDPKLLERTAEKRVARVFELMAQRLALSTGPTPDTPARQLLVTLLEDKERRAVERLFMLLGLLHPQESFERIHRGLESRDPRSRASSRELLESTLVPSLRPAVLTLVDDLPIPERLARAPAALRAATPTAADVIARLQQDGGEAGALAAFYAREAGLDVSERAARAAGTLASSLAAGATS